MLVAAERQRGIAANLLLAPLVSGVRHVGSGSLDDETAARVRSRLT